MFNSRAQLANVETLPFPDNYFDFVFCDVLLQHLPQTDLAMKEMTRVLSPGGRIIISNVNVWNFHTLYKRLLRLMGRPYVYGYERSYTRQEMRRLLKQVGLKVVAQDGFYPAYGIYRLKTFHRLFGLLGKILNRLTKIADRLTSRAISRYFGMEILVVGGKVLTLAILRLYDEN